MPLYLYDVENQIWTEARGKPVCIQPETNQTQVSHLQTGKQLVKLEVPVISAPVDQRFRWSFYVPATKMRMFVALVLFSAILFAVDGDKIDDEEEKLPTRCHGT